MEGRQEWLWWLLAPAVETEEQNQMCASNIVTLQEKAGDFSLKFCTENYPVTGSGKRKDN